MSQSPEICFMLNPSCDSQSHSRIHINVWMTLEESCAIAMGEKLRTNPLCPGGTHEPYQSIGVKSRGNPLSGAKCKGSDFNPLCACWLEHVSISEVRGAEWRNSFCSCQHFGLCVVSPLPLAPGILEIVFLLQGRVGRAVKVVKTLNNEDN